MILYASKSHYADHLWPVWTGMPPDRREAAYSARPGSWWGQYPFRPSKPTSGPQWALVAGAGDYGKVAPRPVVYLEHGAGQSYTGDGASATHPSYPGGARFHRVRLFLTPGPAAAERWRARYPDTPVAEVGSPRLDPWHESAGIRRDRPLQPAVAVTFHWDCHLVPETRWAWPHHRRAVEALVAWCRREGVEVIGHAHPRAWGQLVKWWRRLGVEPTPDFADVLDRATVLVADNTSAGPEFASTGRPVVWLSAPWYRRDVHHDGRFWDWIEGQPHVENPDDLLDVVAHTLAHPEATAEGRAKMVRSVYAYTDGHATDRAVEAVLAVL